MFIFKTNIWWSSYFFGLLCTDITHFQNIVDGFITMTDTLAQEVEKEKMKAIATRNLIKSMAKQREAKEQQYHVSITLICFNFYWSITSFFLIGFFLTIIGIIGFSLSLWAWHVQKRTNVCFAASLFLEMLSCTVIHLAPPRNYITLASKLNLPQNLAKVDPQQNSNNLSSKCWMKCIQKQNNCV